MSSSALCQQTFTGTEVASATSTAVLSDDASFSAFEEGHREASVTLLFRGLSRPAWLGECVERANDLLNLEPNWDSYGGERIEIKWAVEALQLLSQIMVAGAPSPSLVPTAPGGVQLEWHANQVDLEIELGPSGCGAILEDFRSGDIEEIEDISDVGALRQAIRLVCERGADG